VSVDVDTSQGIVAIGSESGWMRLLQLGSLEIVGFVRMDEVVQCEFHFNTSDPDARGAGATLLAASANGAIRVWASDQLPICRPQSAADATHRTPQKHAAHTTPTRTRRTPTKSPLKSTVKKPHGSATKTSFGSRDKMNAIMHSSDNVSTDGPASQFASPQVQSQRLVDASMETISQRLERLPQAASRIPLDQKTALAVGREAANDAVNYTSKNRRYRGLVPLDAPRGERQRPASPAGTPAGNDVPADAAARAAEAMAAAMADDEADIAGDGGDENAACDALALQFLQDQENDLDIARYEAEGAMAMTLLSTGDLGRRGAW